jgi:serine/threonine protein phosphatase PrpC
MIRPVLTWGSASHPGRRRENQDRCLAAPPVFVVADGMGGHALGGAASEAVIARLTGIAHGETVQIDDLRAALRQADEDIRALAEGDAPRDGAGTTVAGVALVESGAGPYWAVFHVGDSRIYRWAAGSWERVSSDHSVVQEMLDGGAITEAQALVHPSRHVITRAVGLGARAEADFTLLPLDGAERFLICSDGLTGELSDRRLGEVLSGAGNAEEMAAQLVSEAVDAGAADNVSVVVVHVHDDRPADEAPEIDALEDATIPRVTVPAEQPEGAS